MEEIIKKISKSVIDELKKGHKPPYPLYYQDVFLTLAKTEGVFEQLNPKLLCIEPSVNESFLKQTANTINEVNNVSKEIKEESETLAAEIAPLQMEEIKDTVMAFSKGLIDKINKLEETVYLLENELDKAYKELLIDPLTKAYNRKALTNDLNAILEKGKEKDLDLVVAVVDLDHFKEINDHYGHLVGDFVLIKLVQIIKKMIRKEHKIYRYGGDEFVIVFNRMTSKQVRPILERITKKISTTLLKYKDELIKVTVSIGATSHKKGDSFEEILKRADTALYEIKEHRNGFKIKD